MELSRIVVLIVGLFSTRALELTVHAKGKQSNSTSYKKLVYDHYRLPTSVRPEKYNLKITTDLKTFKFFGEVAIKLIIMKDTKNITLHAKNLKITKSNIKLENLERSKGKKLKKNCIKNIGTNKSHNYYIMALCRKVKKGDKYLLSIPFSGVLNKKLYGYYRSSYTVGPKNKKIWLSITQFEPTHARMAFPCFDEPIYKAKFTVTLGHHQQYTALSNMPLKALKPMNKKKDWIWSEFDESVPMSTYLVAYSINDFSYETSQPSQKNKVLFRTWTRSDAIDQGNYAREIAPKVLQFYEDTFDIKFPLPKIDQIAIPDFSAGAMENWGLIAYRETSLLYAENASETGKLNVVATIAHELAHQWFGNLVTIKWWSDTWLNEGFATFFSILSVDHIYPKWNYFRTQTIDDLIFVLYADACKNTHAISQPITMTNQITQMFDDISYKKGSVILRMLYAFLGEDTFLRGVNRYLRKHSYKNVEQDDLWKSLIKVSNIYDIKTIMDSWTLQAGYPLITITRDYERRTAKVTQSRFIFSDNNNVDEQSCWWVPLLYVTKSDLKIGKKIRKVWLKCDSNNIPIDKELTDMPKANEWVIFNLQLTALYRVKYDQRNWNMLIDSLVKDDFKNIDAIDRAYHIDNAFNLALNKDETYDIPLRLTRYLKHETEYLPWKTALKNLLAIDKVIRGERGYNIFKIYVSKILDPIYAHLNGLNTTNIKNANSIEINQHKVLISDWACRFEVSDCVPRALRDFAEWRKRSHPDINNPIPIELRDVIYCNAIRYGDAEDWEFVKDRFEKSNTTSEKLQLGVSLACSRQSSKLQYLLNLTFFGDSSLRNQDLVHIFNSVVQNEAGAHLGKEFLVDNVKSLGKFGLHDLLESVAKEIRNRHDFEDLKKSIDKSGKYFLKQDRSDANKMAMAQIHWKENNYVDFLRILKKETFNM